MAKKVTQLVEIIDDLDGKPIEDGFHQEVFFSYGGKDYRMDLRATNAEQLDDLLKPYIEGAEQVGAKRGRPRGTAGSPSATRAPSGSGRSKEELQSIRDWAKKEGHEVSDRGRIAQSIQDAYDEAHKGK